MSFLINEITMKKMFFNGFDVKKWIHEGVVIFTKESVSLVPILTGESTNVLYSGQYSTLYAWKAFDGNDRSRWHQGGGGLLTTAYIGYNFNAYKTVTKVYIVNSYENEKSPSKFKLQGSNDGSEWSDIETFTNTGSITPGKASTFIVSDPKTFKMFRLYMDKDNLNSFSNDKNGVSLSTIQFYGY